MRSLALAILAVLAFAPQAGGATLARDLERALEPVERHAAVAVYDTRAKRTVYALRAGSARPLGSNTKLFTAAAALESLGPFTTSVVGDPAGDLFLVGTGDPTLERAQMEELARQVHARGVRTVAGGIVGDGTRFPPPPPYDPEMGGVLGALVYDRGRAVDGGPFQPDPALAAATRFDDALEALGMTVARGQRSGAAPAGAPLLASVQSAPIPDLVDRMLTRSDNFIAEMLGRALGGPPAGMVDSSGLSPRNRATPRQVVNLLRPRELRRLLPVAGREGTVAHRMKRTRGRCRVKTGTIRGSKVSALAGYCGRYVFAVLVHGAPVGRAQRAQDRVAALLARK